MRRIKNLGLMLSGSVILSGLITGRVFAAADIFCKTSSSTFLGFPTWYKYLDPHFVAGTATTSASCDLTFIFPDDLPKVALAIIEILLRLGGLVAVGFVVYGGFNYITSQGEPEKTKSARNTIVNAVIGIAIATIATVAVAFVGKEFATR